MLTRMLHTDQMKAIDSVHAVAFVPDRQWWEQLFSTIDSGDAAAFVNFLTSDAEFRFGNAAAVHGRDAIAAGVAGFFAAIASSRHRLLEFWSTTRSSGCEGEVTYSRHDGSVLTFPFANIFKFRGTHIDSYRIYIDNSSLFVTPA